MTKADGCLLRQRQAPCSIGAWLSRRQYILCLAPATRTDAVDCVMTFSVGAKTRVALRIGESRHRHGNRESRHRDFAAILLASRTGVTRQDAQRPLSTRSDLPVPMQSWAENGANCAGFGRFPQGCAQKSGNGPLFAFESNGLGCNAACFGICPTHISPANARRF